MGMAAGPEPAVASNAGGLACSAPMSWAPRSSNRQSSRTLATWPMSCARRSASLPGIGHLCRQHRV